MDPGDSTERSTEDPRTDLLLETSSLSLPVKKAKPDRRGSEEEDSEEEHVEDVEDSEPEQRLTENKHNEIIHNRKAD